MAKTRSFYHSFILNDGTKIEGDWDHTGLLDHYQFPVAGKTLLDAACRDGFFSFHFEKLGATVTGLDVADTVPRRQMAEHYGSKMAFEHRNLFDLAEAPPDFRFDVVFFSDVLVHLENPLGALRCLRHVCTGEIYLVSDVHPELQHSVMPMAHLAPMLHWTFGPGALTRLLQMSGWKDVQIVDRFQVSGNTYPTRNVALLHGVVDPAFSLPALQACAETNVGEPQRLRPSGS